MFDYLHKAWGLYRATTSPALEWRADAVYPGFDDRRSFIRWFRAEAPAMESLAIEQVQKVIEADMMFRTIVERDRNTYMTGDMMDDSLIHGLHDTRMFFPHQLPFKFPQQSDDPVDQGDDHGSGRKKLESRPIVVKEPPPARTRIRSNIRHESWWVIELQEIQRWNEHGTQEAPQEAHQLEQSLPSDDATAP